MANLSVYFLVIIVLCQSIAVFPRQIDFDSVNGGVQIHRQIRQATTTTVPPPSFTACIEACNVRTTPQYNPVCGENDLSYHNRQRLECAQQCGLSVKVLHGGTCGPSPGGK